MKKFKAGDLVTIKWAGRSPEIGVYEGMNMSMNGHLVGVNGYTYCVLDSMVAARSQSQVQSQPKSQVQAGQFKLSDRVKVIKIRSSKQHYLNCVGIISATDQSYNTKLPYLVDINGDNVWVASNDIELISADKFKVGDKVRIKAIPTGSFIGKAYIGCTGVIRQTDKSTQPFYVKIDNPPGSYSNMWLSLNEIELILDGQFDLNIRKDDLYLNDTNPPKLPKKGYDKLPEQCTMHHWETVGRSPVTNVEWINCKYCGVAKEDVIS